MFFKKQYFIRMKNETFFFFRSNNLYENSVGLKYLFFTQLRRTCLIMLIKEFRGCVENKPCLYKNIYRNKIWLEKQQFSKSLLIRISFTSRWYVFNARLDFNKRNLKETFATLVLDILKFRFSKTKRSSIF